MIWVAVIAAAIAGLACGLSLGWHAAVATRTTRDARATTQAAKRLWWQVPRDWAAAVRPVLLLAVLVVAAIAGLSAR